MDSEFLIYDKRAGIRHIQTALAFAAVLALASVAVFPYRLLRLPKVFGFIPVIDTMHLLFYCISAAVLLSLASILRSRALIVLGAGYFFTALVAMVHGLTFPNAFSPTGLLGAHSDTGTWLYLCWHTVLPACILIYAFLKNTPWDSNLDRAPLPTIFTYIGLALVAAAVVSWAAATGTPSLSDDERLKYTNLWHYMVIVLSAVTMALLWRRQRSILDLCLTLTLWAWFLEYVLIFPRAARFSVGWYAGRAMGLVSGLFVLLMLLIEMSRLYARTVMLIDARRRERENRLMLGEAVGAFIAHELRQPLAAISLNAYTAQKLDIQTGSELSGVLDDLMKDSRRANDIIESTRAIFGEAGGEKRPTDINQLVRDTLLMTSYELRNHGVRVEVELDDRLPLVAVNRMQMQQVFMNLFINAAEAMSGITERPRQLTIRSSSGRSGSDDVELIIRVEDTGPRMEAGDQERIFEPFFTTKEHGTGMGLSICRSVVQAHGGSIRMAPRTPFGTSFEILLPNGLAAGG